MDESRRMGKSLYCCFVDFKKAFDTVPRDGLWERMQMLGVPIELCMGIYRLYERVVCHLKSTNGFSQAFVSNMGVKQGCPLSPTLFGLCIDELEEMILEYAQSNVIDGPQIGLFVVLVLLYGDDVALLAYTIEGLQKLLELLHAFCRKSGLVVNVSKTKFMIV